MNITTFIEWFFTQIFGIGATLIEYIDNITLNETYEITLLDLMIYVIIISAVFKIITTQVVSNRISREGRRKNV